MLYRLFKYVLTFLMLVVGLPLLAWGFGFLVFASSISSMKTPQDIAAADAAIVLTGGTGRVAAGLDLLAEDKIKNLLISGVGKEVTRKGLLKKIDYKKKLPDCCITLGHEAENTIGNAMEAHKWLESHQSQTVYIVTSNYHMPRALVEFHHALGDDIRIIPFPVKPEEFDSEQEIFWKLSFLEYHKYLLTLLRVQIDPQATKPMPEALTQ